MRQNKSYEIYSLMPGRYIPGIFLLFPESLDHRLLRIMMNQSLQSTTLSFRKILKML